MVLEALRSAGAKGATVPEVIAAVRLNPSGVIRSLQRLTERGDVLRREYREGSRLWFRYWHPSMEVFIPADAGIPSGWEEVGG
jgi:hypothetical protein